MAASHFFVGLGAGIALLAVPVLLFTPGSSVPRQVVEWIEGPPQGVQLADLTNEDAAGSRPLSGYQAGDPTPAAQAVPTIQPQVVQPTPRPTPSAAARLDAAAGATAGQAGGGQAAVGQAAVGQADVGQAGVGQAAVGQAAVGLAGAGYLRWSGTGMIRSGGMPVYVRRVAGVDSRDDPQIADGAPVLIGAGPPQLVGAQAWRAVRGLNGVVGWVPSSQLIVDGEAASPSPSLTPTAGSTAQVEHGRIANTGGSGVVLRNSPNDADRSRAGLMDGAAVSLLEFSGSDWVHVRADTGQSGWVPARYVSAG
jgi:SH3-like domain-containing protein